MDDGVHQLDIQVNVVGLKWSDGAPFLQARLDARCRCGHIFYVGWVPLGQDWKECYEAVLAVWPFHESSEK